MRGQTEKFIILDDAGTFETPVKEKSISQLMDEHNANIAKEAVKWVKNQPSKHSPNASSQFKSVYITKPEIKNKCDYWK